MSLFKKTTIGLLATALVAGSLGTAFADDNKARGFGPRGGMMPKFEKVDANSDGSVTFEEFAKPLNDRFDTADADKNGSVNAEEITAAIDGRRAEDMAQRLTGRFDINKDGNVSKEEIENRQKKLFALMDMDDSGTVTKEEIPARMDRDGGRHGDRDGKRKGGQN